MALTYPFLITEGYEWANSKFTPVVRQELSRTAGAKAQGKDLGPMVWEAEFESLPLEKREADVLEAKLRSLRGFNRTCFVHVAEQPFPQAYSYAFLIKGFPGGEGAGFSSGFSTGFLVSAVSSITYSPVQSGVVASISNDRNQVSISGLNPGLQLSFSDYLSVVTASGSTELLQLTEDAVADETGLTPEIQLSHPLRPSVTVGDGPVHVAEPRMEAFVPFESISNTKVSGLLHRVKFKAVQVVR